MWRRAYLGSDLQLLGLWAGPNRQQCFVACGDESLGSEPIAKAIIIILCSVVQFRENLILRYALLCQATCMINTVTYM